MLRTCLAMALCISTLAAGLFALNIGKTRDIAGATLINEVTLCESADCARGQTQALPFTTRPRLDASIDSHVVWAEVAAPGPQDSLYALYLPKFAETVDISVNGQRVFEKPPATSLWNTPLLLPLPQVLLQAQTVRIDITLYGHASEGLDLFPFYFGPSAALTPHYNLRNFFGLGLARFALGLMIVLTTALLVVWSFRRSEREYLWLGLASATTIPTLVHFGFGASFGSYGVWTVLWAFPIPLYVFLLLKFIRHLLNIDFAWSERGYAAVIFLSAAVILLVPEDYTFAMVMLGNVLLTVPSTCVGLANLWLHRNVLQSLDRLIFFAPMFLAAVLGLYDLFLLSTNTPARSMHLFHLMPASMSLACIWLILSRLIHSLRGLESLSKSLHQTVEEKSAELEASFAELTEIRYREAIMEERARIMLDLHDGIGGQLVSTLAYMERNQVGDTKIRRALEDALRDLALMLDSMENEDSLVTLLGMMRTRLEGLLSEHGLEFDWQVHGEPKLAKQGPSHNLHLARIVQEAITNVIKHTKADRITVYVDEDQIRISDNGQGFDVVAQEAAAHPAHGIANMKRRSVEIGADFLLESDGSGTDITLRIGKADAA